MSPVFDAIVIGGGQAGLATGYHLKRAGLNFLILEAGSQPAGSWAQYYDHLKLFSPARYSSLPGIPFPGDPDHYPTRDEVVAYLVQYATHFELPVQLHTRVKQVHREGTQFRITTVDGREFRAHSLIAATGSFHHPFVPEIPGRDKFQGQVLHSVQYRNPEPFRNKRVVVVGAGNSAVQIAVEVAKVADVTLATREPINFKPQRLLGKDIHFWSIITGLDSLPLGYWREVGKSVGVLDTGVYQAAIAVGKPDRRPMFTHFTENGVSWADGSTEAVDAVVLATGYRPSVEYLSPIGATDEVGRPLHRGGVSLTVPGLYYVGLSGQRSVASATLRGVGSDAAHVVSHLRRYLKTLVCR
jgi:putative flavoprotein involved in K+ transport